MNGMLILTAELLHDLQGKIDRTPHRKAREYLQEAQIHLIEVERVLLAARHELDPAR